MEAASAAVQSLIAATGMMWVYAAALAALAAMLEGARSNEKKEGGPGLLVILSGISALVTPFLLFVHGFWALSLTESPNPEAAPTSILLQLVQESRPMWALLAIMAIIIVIAAIPGWVLRKSTPGVADIAAKAAPFVAIAALGLTIYATYEYAGAFISMFT